MQSGAFLTGIVVSTALFGCFGCNGDAHDTGAFPRSQTLYVGGYQFHEPASFNPLASAPDWPVQPHNSVNLMYEPLFVFDTIAGKLEPLLGQSFTVHDMHVDVIVQPRARFSDGKPVTADDVKYTFDLGSQHKSLPVAALWAYLESIEITDPSQQPHPRQLRFHLNPKRKNPLILLDY